VKLGLTACLCVLSLLAAPANAHFEEGQIYAIDLVNNTVYYINPEAGFFFQVAGNPSAIANSPSAIGFNAHGHMLLHNKGDDTIYELTGGGSAELVLTAADGLDGAWGPSALVIGPGHGDLYVANYDLDQILSFDEEFENGSVFADAADGLDQPSAMAFLPDGHMMVSDRGNNYLHHFNTDTGVGTLFDKLPETPIEVIARNNGDVYVLTNAGNIFRYIGGSAINRVLLGNYGGPSARGGMDFKPGHDQIYHVSTVDGALREIDADTGASAVRVFLPGTPISLAVVGSQYAPGTYYHFGHGLEGTGGVEPELHGHEEPRVGQASEIEAHDFVGGSTIFLFLSAIMDENDFKGGEFYIGGIGTPAATFIALPAGGTPGVAGDGGLELPFALPNDPMFSGVKFFLQALGTDPGAPLGVSFSAGLTMYIGS